MVDRIKTNQQSKPENQQKKKSGFEKKVPVFNCVCGTKISIISDLAEMNRVIENHLIEHKRLTGLDLTDEQLSQEILKVIIKAINEA